MYKSPQQPTINHSATPCQRASPHDLNYCLQIPDTACRLYILVVRGVNARTYIPYMECLANEGLHKDIERQCFQAMFSCTGSSWNPTRTFSERKLCPPPSSTAPKQQACYHCSTPCFLGAPPPQIVSHAGPEPHLPANRGPSWEVWPIWCGPSPPWPLGRGPPCQPRLLNAWKCCNASMVRGPLAAKHSQLDGICDSCDICTWEVKKLLYQKLAGGWVRCCAPSVLACVISHHTSRLVCRFIMIYLSDHPWKDCDRLKLL